MKNRLLNTYPAFRFLNWMRYVKIESIPLRNLVFTLFFMSIIILSSYLDGTFFMSGDNIGLFQHPTIWGFFIIQIVSPFIIQNSLGKLLSIDKWKYCIIKHTFLKQNYKDELKSLKKQITFKTALSRGLFTILFFIGFIAFVWNTYQNQMPVKYLGFDFWDSYNHSFAYWSTRIYKLYLWCLFFPSIFHLYLLIVLKTIAIIQKSYKLKMLVVEPYHFDEQGGFSIFIENIINPLIPLLFCTSLLSVCILLVHKKLDFTSTSSLVLTTIVFLIFYLIPAIKIRSIITKEKERQLGDINKKQKQLLKDIVSKEGSSTTKDDFETLTVLETIVKQIKSIPNWPNYKFIMKVVAIAYTPAVINIIVKTVIPLFNKA